MELTEATDPEIIEFKAEYSRGNESFLDGTALDPNASEAFKQGWKSMADYDEQMRSC